MAVVLAHDIFWNDSEYEFAAFKFSSFWALKIQCLSRNNRLTTLNGGASNVSERKLVDTVAWKTEEGLG